MKQSHRWLSPVLVALFCHCPASQAVAAEPPPKPNFIVIVSDDQGWNDIGYHDTDVLTPNLDKLARAGVRLERNYVYPTCSPTRVALLTGRNPSRFGVLAPIAGRSGQALPPETVTLARALKSVGYETAITGKWHLGLRPEVGPRQYGFDRSYGYFHGQLDQYSHEYKNGDRTWHRDDKFVDEKGHATDLIVAEAVRFIEAKRDGPFFLYVPFSVPHHPVQEESKWVARYRGSIENESRLLYASSLSHMDFGVGQLIDALDRTGQRDRTLVVFSSDNGGQRSWNAPPSQYGGRHKPNPVLGDNKPLRGWKGELYEGGVRVPAFASWPGVLEPREVNAATHIMDWYPTFARLAGHHIPKTTRVEGQDIWPLLTGAAKPEPRVLYWKTPGDYGLMDGDWKLIVKRKDPSHVELFNLADDPREQKNLAAKAAGRLTAMRALLEQQRALDD